MELKKRVVYIIVDGMGSEAFEQATSSKSSRPCLPQVPG